MPSQKVSNGLCGRRAAQEQDPEAVAEDVGVDLLAAPTYKLASVLRLVLLWASTWRVQKIANIP